MMLDSLFTLLFLLTVFYFYRGHEKDEGRQKYFLLAGLFMGFGVLTKGLIAYLVIPIFLIFAFSQKRSSRFGIVTSFWGVLLSFLIVSLWLLPACRTGGEDYTKRLLFGQTIVRLMGEEKYFNPESIFFYFFRFPLDFLPWIVFLPSAIVFGFRNGEDIRKGYLFLVIWFLSIFLFFTLSRGKKDNYLLPLYPTAAMMAGLFWDSELRSSKGKREFILGLFLLSFLFLIGFILSLMGIPEKLHPSFIIYHPLELWVLSYLIVGSFLPLLFFLKHFLEYFRCGVNCVNINW